MTISSLDAVQSYTSQLFSSQQAQTVTDPFLPDPSASGTGRATASDNAAASNSLTGTGTASLDSQTLGALLGLTQQDPTDPSQQGGQATQVQGAHHHHHHHGGGGTQAPSSASASMTTSTTDPTAATDTTAEADDVDASLEAALVSA